MFLNYLYYTSYHVWPSAKADYSPGASCEFGGGWLSWSNFSDELCLPRSFTRGFFWALVRVVSCDVLHARVGSGSRFQSCADLSRVFVSLTNVV